MKVWIVQGNYKSCGGIDDWDDENTELTKEAAQQSLREYKESGPGVYRLITRTEGE